MPTYKTPGVYVEEISTLPRSVAEVETAIPAFIGYTQTASRKNKDVSFVPTRVSSLVEYESIFGAGPSVDIESLSLDANNALLDVSFSDNYLLYDSIRLFFRNGGGKCYIISVGSYGDPVEAEDFFDGLEVLKREDEPTLILFPDAVLLGEGLYDIQVEALSQCNALKDRFVIMDLLEAREGDDAWGWAEGVEEFRNRIGVNYLKYGAAYTPYLKTSLPHSVTYRSLSPHVTTIRNLAEPAIQQTFVNLDRAIDDVDLLNSTAWGATDLSDVEADFLGIQDDLKTAINTSNLGDARTELDNLLNFIYDAAVGTLDAWANPASQLSNYTDADGVAISGITSNRQVAQSAIDNVALDTLATLNSYVKELDDTTGASATLYTGRAQTADWTAGGEEDDPWDDANVDADNTIYPFDAPADDAEFLANIRAIEKKATGALYELLSAVAGVIEKADALEATFESNLKEQYPLYSNIAAEVGQALMTLPPSGAIAGVYAAVDANRGVWKAPANVSLASVSELTEMIDHEEQAELNVDATAGKSINAIRPFTGRGIIVWGARTLAGNDNEWRYINVRRFYNMVEESIKKSTVWAVFEPNDAKLWTNLKSMVENYLTLKWKDGALAGAKPEQAFFVNVGLGITMTPQDILEGRLVVEIGMAVVRPAEFIILRFSHKMQEA